MYPGFVLIMYGNTEMPVMREDVYIHRSLKARNTPWHAGPYGEGSGVKSQRGGEKGENDPKPLLGFS